MWSCITSTRSQKRQGGSGGTSSPASDHLPTMYHRKIFPVYSCTFPLCCPCTQARGRLLLPIASRCVALEAAVCRSHAQASPAADVRLPCFADVPRCHGQRAQGARINGNPLYLNVLRETRPRGGMCRLWKTTDVSATGQHEAVCGTRCGRYTTIAC